MIIKKKLLIFVWLIFLSFSLSGQESLFVFPKNQEEFNDIKNKSLRGDPQEKAKYLYEIGYCYEHGIVVEKNIKEAVNWYIKSGSRNYIPAWLTLAHVYESRNNPIMSLKSYYNAALIGSDEAEQELAGIFEEDNDIIAGHYLSRLYYKRNDNKNFEIIAYNNVKKGDIFIQWIWGKYITKKYAKDPIRYLEGFHWLEKVATSDSAKVMNILAQELGIASNNEDFVNWYGWQTQETISNAWIEFGVLCLEGTAYTQKDPQRAVILFQKAAERGNIEAMKYLEKCYTSGTGVTKNSQKALYWKEKAEEREDNGLLESYMWMLGL